MLARRPATPGKFVQPQQRTCGDSTRNDRFCRDWKPRSVTEELTRPASSAAKLGQPRCPICAFARSIFVVPRLNLREVPTPQSIFRCLDGRSEARPVCPGPLAADQDRCDVGSCTGRRRRSADRERVPAQALSWHPDSSSTAGVDRHGLISRTIGLKICYYRRDPCSLVQTRRRSPPSAGRRAK
jgi:hypothetical protein